MFKAIPGLFLFIFGLFKQTTQFLPQMQKCPPSIRYWDSNPRQLEHESPSITTRPNAPCHECHLHVISQKDN